MRMKAEPCDQNNRLQPKIDHSHNNFLQESLLASLKESEACFDIFLQPNNDPKNNSLEDTTLIWDESISPFIKVARLEIQKQDDFASAERMAFCENLSFNPWHSSPELRPMGQINRIRQIVYDGISKYRHANNKIPEIEPVDFQACVGTTEPLCRVK
jgi:catalase